MNSLTPSRLPTNPISVSATAGGNPSASSRSRRWLSGFLGLVALVGWVGCAGINPRRMAPEAGGNSGRGTGMSVQVMEVTGGKKSTFGGPDLVNNEQFREALILALKDSGLFTRVGTDPGDLQLFANIRSQDQKAGRGLEYTATMLATYRFVQNGSNTVWSESYESEFSSTTFSGAARSLRAREGSVRENLKSLLAGIRQRSPAGGGK